MPLRLGRSRRPHLHTHGGQPEGQGCGFCEENAGAGRENEGVKVGWEILTSVFSVDLSGRFVNGVRSGEQERALAHHCRRHSEVK